jgi:hypothetical protein
MSTLSLGISAGLIAGVITDAFLFATGVLVWPHAYEFIASALVGKAALASSAYVPLGIAMHFAISAAWGAAFGLTAQRYPQLVGRPIAAGLTFGLVVLIVMQLLLAVSGMWRAPQSAGQVVASIAAHTLFFGVPIAWYVARASLRLRAAQTGRG